MKNLLDYKTIFREFTPNCRRKRPPKNRFNAIKKSSVHAGMGLYVSTDARTVLFPEEGISVIVAQSIYDRWVELKLDYNMSRILRTLNSDNTRGYLSVVNKIDNSLFSVIYDELYNVLELGWELYDHS